jgi:hypothetical protein
MTAMLLGRRRLRDLGPLERMIRAARNPGPADEAATAGTMLLVSLSVACGALSLLLGPR